MLFVPFSSAQSWTYNNWGANPASTTGTAVTPTTSNANPSTWTQIASAANISQDVYGIYVQFHSGATASQIKSHLVDIGVDPAGGTSYAAIISDFNISNAPALNSIGCREHFFPLFIPAGSSVAARIRGSNATAGTVRVAAVFFGQRSLPEALPVCSYSVTFGADSANSRGTTITRGNAADGSGLDLGATTVPLWWWQLGNGIANGTITAEYTYFELAYGDASNKQQIFRVMHGGSTNETAGLFHQMQMLWHAAYCPVPVGANIYVRARCNNAPDSGYHVNVLGIGG
jgi:hypothetical protein